MKKIVFMATDYKKYKSLIDTFIASEIQLTLLNEYSKELLKPLLKKEIDLVIIEACNKQDLMDEVMPIVQYIQALNRKQNYMIMTQDESLMDMQTIFAYPYVMNNIASLLDKYGIGVYCKTLGAPVVNEDNKHIVIIDDDWLSASVLKTILKSKYKHITLFTNALEGLRDIQEKIGSNQRVDAIFLDLMMPIMDGFKFLEKHASKSQMAHIPVFITTSRNDKESVIRAAQYNVVEYIIKPYNKEIILEKLERVFNEKE